MKLVYTEQALVSLEETLEFYATKVSFEKMIQIRDQILDKADTLLKHPYAGRKNLFLKIWD